jgi:hypothetical protein
MTVLALPPPFLAVRRAFGVDGLRGRVGISHALRGLSRRRGFGPFAELLGYRVGRRRYSWRRHRRWKLAAYVLDLPGH